MRSAMSASSGRSESGRTGDVGWVRSLSIQPRSARNIAASWRYPGTGSRNASWPRYCSTSLSAQNRGSSPVAHAWSRAANASGRERREPEQVVRAVDDHVDRQVVAGEEQEVRPLRVADREPLPLLGPVERRVLEPDRRRGSRAARGTRRARRSARPGWNIGRARSRAAGRPPPRAARGRRRARRRPARRARSDGNRIGQPAGARRSRRTRRAYASPSNGAPGASATCAPATHSPGRSAPPRCAAHRARSAGVEHRTEAGVHVDRGDEPGVDGAGEVRLEAGPVDRAVVRERQQHRRHPGDRPAGPDPAVHCGHRCSAQELVQRPRVAQQRGRVVAGDELEERDRGARAASGHRRVPQRAEHRPPAFACPRRAGADPPRPPTRRRGGARAAARAPRPRPHRRPAVAARSQYGGCQ